MFNARTIFTTLILAVLAASPCVADYVSTVTGTSGLVGYWRFETDANSSVGVIPYTGLLSGTAALSGPGGGAPLAGNPNNHALVLSGGNGNGVVTNMGDQEPLYNGATFMMWINAASFPAPGRYDLINKEVDNADMTVINDGGGLLWSADHWGNKLEGSPGEDLVAGEWHHLTFTFDDATTTSAMYLDGSLLASRDDVTHQDLDGGVLAIGGYKSGLDRSFNGSMDEVAVFDRALSLGEIGAIYDSRLVPEPSSLVLLACGLVGLLCYAWRKRKCAPR